MQFKNTQMHTVMVVEVLLPRTLLWCKRQNCASRASYTPTASPQPESHLLGGTGPSFDTFPQTEHSCELLAPWQCDTGIVVSVWLLTFTELSSTSLGVNK